MKTAGNYLALLMGIALGAVGTILYYDNFLTNRGVILANIINSCAGTTQTSTEMHACVNDEISRYLDHAK